MRLKHQWAEDAVERIATKVLQAIERRELEDAARAVDSASTETDSPRTRQLVQFVATAAVLRSEAEKVKRP